MAERYGYRPPTEIDKEPPKENPIKSGPGMPGDNAQPTDNTTPANIEGDLGTLDDTDSSQMDDIGLVEDTSFPRDETFTDKADRSITTRTWENGDQYMIRAYDQEVQSPPDSPNIGQAGYANLTLERDMDESVTRARLNDIQTSPEYRGSGIGGQMLNTAEQIAQQHDAKEIYGHLSYEAEDEAAVRGFYQNHGYGFRTTDQGEEITKSLEDVGVDNRVTQDDRTQSDFVDVDLLGDNVAAPDHGPGDDVGKLGDEVGEW